MSELWDDGDIWGHKTVTGAMDDFVDSWWVKREKLQENLKDLQSKMEKAAETWNNTEIELEKSLADKSEWRPTRDRRRLDERRPRG